MAIDPSIYSRINTDFGQQLGSLFDPNLNAERNNRLSALANQDALQKMQMMQGMQQMQRQPELMRREDFQYQQQQAAQAKAAQDEQQIRQAVQAAGGDTQKVVQSLVQNGSPAALEWVTKLKALMPKPAEPYTLGDGAVRYDANNMEVARGAPKARDANQPFMPDGSPNVPFQNYQRSLKPQGDERQRGQIVFDNKGNAFNVNPYTNEVKPVAMDGSQIQGAQYSPDLQGQIAGAKASGKETGQATGEATARLQDMEATMPRLEVVVSELSNLGKKATYTMAGQGADAVRRQFGMNVGEGAVARKEYLSKVDNEILPLLRQTFGAQFTQKEGESLKATLGDPNASPEEKDAVLKSFIETKYGQIKGLRSRTGAQPTAPTQPGASGQWGIQRVK